MSNDRRYRVKNKRHRCWLVSPVTIAIEDLRSLQVYIVHGNNHKVYVEYRTSVLQSRVRADFPAKEIEIEQVWEKSVAREQCMPGKEIGNWTGSLDEAVHALINGMKTEKAAKKFGHMFWKKRLAFERLALSMKKEKETEKKTKYKPNKMDAISSKANTND